MEYLPSKFEAAEANFVSILSYQLLGVKDGHDLYGFGKHTRSSDSVFRRN